MTDDETDQRRPPARRAGDARGGGERGPRLVVRPPRASAWRTGGLALVLLVATLLSQPGVAAAVHAVDEPRGQSPIATLAGTATDPGASCGIEPDESAGLRSFATPHEPTMPPTIAVFSLRRNEASDGRQEDPALDNDARAAIYEVVTDAPGSSMSEVADRTGIPLSTVRYHSQVLTNEDVIDEAKIRGKRRLYPARMGADRRELAAAMADDATASLLATTYRIEPASVSELARALDRSASTVSYHLARLERAGLVERERDGDATATRLEPFVRAALAHDGPAVGARRPLD